MSSILLIEDHPMFANTIQHFLTSQADLEITGIVKTGEEALEKLPELKIDLVLADVSLPTMNGIEAVRQIHVIYPHLHCLILSGHMSQKYVKLALNAGASGYVLKDDVNGLLEGIRKALAGEFYVSPALR
jgi:DNA-binding NarL/FixJ family response regulator